MDSRFKIFSDPVHGFISVPKNVVLALIHTPEVQRLRRIRQLGVGHLVFPGAEHTRFGHALGAMALMQDALSSLTEKGTPIHPDEQCAALACALLHDVGHGPFSHTLEHELIDDFRHEDMSRVLIEALNERFEGALDLALAIFDDTYERPFFHQLITSQLDMDRLDYLRRDSFFTGVVEGRVGVDRIIKTLRVYPTDGGHDARIVIEEKGMYAVENFVLSRQLMYWQVYLHKTVLAGDQLLRALFRRVRDHLRRETGIPDASGSPALLYFLRHALTRDDIHRPDVRQTFCALDDTDVIYSLKQWAHCDDPVLADLSRRFLNRSFFRVSFLEHPPTEDEITAWHSAIAAWLRTEGLAHEDAEEAADLYLVVDRSEHSAYRTEREQAIAVIGRDGIVRELSETTNTAAVSAMTRYVVKPYVCYPKEATLPDLQTAAVTVGGG